MRFLGQHEVWKKLVTGMQVPTACHTPPPPPPPFPSQAEKAPVLQLVSQQTHGVSG